MDRVPRIAAVNDLSGYGRCSLTVALPILAAMGFQPCPVPTAILSAHTGYPSPHIVDFTPHIAPYLAHWEQLGIHFEAIYTGFLGSAEQVRDLKPFIQHHRAAGAVCMVDPAMADHGRLYSSCDESLVEAMRRLVCHATVTTPNLTEACLLTGTDYDRLMQKNDEDRMSSIRSMALDLTAMGCGAAVITGVPDGADRLLNVVADGDTCFTVGSMCVPTAFAGTGDVFSAVLCGYLARGLSLEQAVDRTTSFVYDVTRYTAQRQTATEDGIQFEPFLSRLCPPDGETV